MLNKEDNYAVGKYIPTTTDVKEVYNLYKLGNDESIPNRCEYRFLFSWNYNRLDEEGKNAVCNLIMKGV